jgi:hypothetical protein
MIGYSFILDRSWPFWAKNGIFFIPAAGAEAFKRDVPDVRRLNLFVDAGHFASETRSRHGEIGQSVHAFLSNETSGGIGIDTPYLFRKKLSSK